MTSYTQFRRTNRRTVGMEIFEITPIMLGGDPIDPTNKTLLTRQQHIQAVQYWNAIIRKMRQAR